MTERYRVGGPTNIDLVERVRELLKPLPTVDAEIARALRGPGEALDLLSVLADRLEALQPVLDSAEWLGGLFDAMEFHAVQDQDRPEGAEGQIVISCDELQFAIWVQALGAVVDAARERIN